jgi:mono/diheme cytochrome c family protein
VLFTMLSNHFPSTYGNSLNWAVLLLLLVFGASLKYFMNYRLTARKDVVAAGGVALVGVISLTLASVPHMKVNDEFLLQPSVPFTRVAEILSARCLTCHATIPANSAFSQPPLGIVFEDPKRVQALAGRIYLRAVATKTMPLGNLTGMTEAERKEIGVWVAHGASTDGVTEKLKNEGPAAPALVLTGSPADSAKTLFATRCVTCHGVGGRGDGPTGAFLTPHPRDFTNVAWQRSVQDDDLRKIIAKGGAAVGKSPLMPANPDFADNRPVLDEVVKLVRSLEGGAAPAMAPCAEAKPPAKPLPPPEAAKQIFATRCATCHGATGHGDGPTAAGFPTKPRNFTDPAWQAGVTDDALRKVIAKGGAAVGKNALMPHNPDLDADPALLDEMVKIVRGLAKK